MLISVNWLRDFVELPDNLDVHALAERFTMTCAEVEGVEPIAISAAGLIAAKIVSWEALADTHNLKRVVLDLGDRRVETISAAPVLRDDALVVYAPPGARTNKTGPIGETTVAGHASSGMILSGDAIGIDMAADEAIFCPPSMSPGQPIDPAPFDDWVIEVDNKSITHRPDLWGHYGIAREIAAMLGTPLRPYPVVEVAELLDSRAPAVRIDIDDASRCPRYSALRMTGVGAQAAPLWMQTRLGHVGMRPIDCLVDLSNYIMAELGQPTHAFDGEKIERVEIGLAEPGSVFTTLDGMERTLPAETLMIMCNRRPVALAGIMGGLETEVTDHTRTILLESANFEAAGIRRGATALGLRTEASARFEKSLDPAHTILAIQRFVALARNEFPNLALASPLSDSYPSPAETLVVEVDPDFVRRFMGHDVSTERMTAILTALDFRVEPRGGLLRVTVPSFRATKDISIEADIIEEIARSVGYDHIESRLPDVTVRHFPPNDQHRVERDTLRMLCRGLGYSEVHLYIWNDKAWLDQLGVKPGSAIELRNPAAAGQEMLRHQLMPGLLRAVERNRFHTDHIKLCEVGSVFPGQENSTTQSRRAALVLAQRGKKVEDTLLATLKGDIETWAWQVFDLPATFVPADGADRPAWAHSQKTAAVMVGAIRVGTVSVVPLTLRRAMDEHLTAWAVAWAEIDLDPLGEARPDDIKLRPIPEHPDVELDFSMLVDAATGYGQVNEKLTGFDHPLLRRVTYVGAFEGGSVPDGKRSLTYRCVIGAGDRTLAEADLSGFRQAFESHVSACGFEQR